MKSLGFFVVGTNGHPLGNLVSTLEEAEAIARFEPSAKIYELKDRNGIQTWLSLVQAKDGGKL